MQRGAQSRCGGCGCGRARARTCSCGAAGSSSACTSSMGTCPSKSCASSSALMPANRLSAAEEAAPAGAAEAAGCSAPAAAAGAAPAAASPFTLTAPPPTCGGAGARARVGRWAGRRRAARAARQQQGSATGRAGQGRRAVHHVDGAVLLDRHGALQPGGSGAARRGRRRGRRRARGRSRARRRELSQRAVGGRGNARHLGPAIQLLLRKRSGQRAAAAARGAQVVELPVACCQATQQQSSLGRIGAAKRQIEVAACVFGAGGSAERSVGAGAAAYLSR
jgi:hypothetical protein